MFSSSYSETLVLLKNHHELFKNIFHIPKLEIFRGVHGYGLGDNWLNFTMQKTLSLINKKESENNNPPPNLKKNKVSQTKTASEKLTNLLDS